MSEEILPNAVQMHPVGTRITLTDRARIKGGQETAGVTGTVIQGKNRRRYTWAELDTPIDGLSTMLLKPNEFTLLEAAE